MPRTEEMLRRTAIETHVAVAERTTLRHDVPGGATIRHDGNDFWMICHGPIVVSSWHGDAPKEWDADSAVEDEFEYRYEQCLDYS